jgi:hypothetical protein
MPYNHRADHAAEQGRSIDRVVLHAKWLQSAKARRFGSRHSGSAIFYEEP